MATGDQYCTICGAFGHAEGYHYGHTPDYRPLPALPQVDQLAELRERIERLEEAVFGVEEEKPKPVGPLDGKMIVEIF